MNYAAEVPAREPLGQRQEIGRQGQREGRRGGDEGNERGGGTGSPLRRPLPEPKEALAAAMANAVHIPGVGTFSDPNEHYLAETR